MGRKLTDREIARYRTWYSDARETLVREYGDDAELFAGLLAATSPRKQVQANWKLALQVYRSWKAGGPINMDGTLPAHRGNIGRALRGETLSGEKVESFRQNLIGCDDAVTIDVWMCRWMRSDKERLTPKQYRTMADKIRRKAKSYKLTPAEYQAVAWSAVRSDNGLAYRSFTQVFHNLSAQMTLWDE